MGIEDVLASHRSDLLRYARLQLRNDAWAEDAVSDTLLAALAHPQAFEGRSQLKTWLIGILKHKIVDILRRHARDFTSPLGSAAEDAAAGQELDGLVFKDDGHFVDPPADWGDPQQALANQQFIRVLEACLERLPASQGRAFLMREWLELTSDEICKELKLTPTNLYVLLHRARLRLRECLDVNWFGQTASIR